MSSIDTLILPSGLKEDRIANLKDVARRAGVDPSTVSRVLREDPAQHVRPATRQRIVEAAQALGYRPNALARSLRMRRTGTIGLVIPSLDSVGSSDVTHGIQRAAAEAGRLLLVLEAEALPEGARRSEEIYARLVGDGLVDGLIVACARLQDHHVTRLAVQGIPLVLVNGRTSGISGSVVVDDRRGTRLAVEHLTSLGHERIAYVGLDEDSDAAQRRRRGYLDGLAAAGLRPVARLEESGPPTVDGGRGAIGRILARSDRDPPTAVVVASLMSALGVRAGLAEAGRRIPDDVSLIAFNDHPIAEHIAPALTTVRMPNQAMGEEAVRMLLAALDGQAVRDVMIGHVPEVVVRASTAAPGRPVLAAGVGT